MINKFIKKYAYYAILLVVTYILFFCISYETLNKNKKLNSFNVNNKVINLKNEVHINEKIYMSYDDVQSFLANDVYVDKISRKIIITSKDNIRKYELNSNKKQINFQNTDSENIVYTKEDGKDYLLLDEIADMYNYQIVFNHELNSLKLIIKDYVEGTFENNRVVGYLDKNKKDTRVYLTGNNVQVIKNEEFYDDRSILYTVITKQNNKDIVVFVLKTDIKLEEEEKAQTSVQSQNFITMFYNEENGTIDNFTNCDIVGGLKLVSKEGNVENNINNATIQRAKEYNKQVYVSLNNGYLSSNFDNTITTQMLQSDISRENLISYVADTIKNTSIDGIAINFRQLNSSCKEDFTQFIKEIAAYLHSINKKILVYIPLNSNYIDFAGVSSYSDFVILIQYGIKDITSKTSGSDSGINWIRNNLNDLINENIAMSKIIMEIPLYSILWIEKNNKLIDAERINMKTLEEYVSKNKLTPVIDEITKQNYIEFVKGSLKYKIWLEDKYSVKQKINLAKEFGLAGISFYKKGYESQNILSVIGGK